MGPTFVNFKAIANRPRTANQHTKNGLTPLAWPGCHNSRPDPVGLAALTAVMRKLIVLLNQLLKNPEFTLA
tara:strand:- start:2423 stop:2635 length:213 start_codon:yes stop_codon:yes gene_type:complete